jgi:hypothetical protein
MLAAVDALRATVDTTGQMTLHGAPSSPFNLICLVGNEERFFALLRMTGWVAAVPVDATGQMTMH